jgi:WD40 repeat protein
MKLGFDYSRNRIIAGGLDNQLKFLSVEDDEIKVAYKMKLPSEIFCIDFSQDGNHYAVGLNDGSLIIKSKLLEELKEED